MKNFELQTLDEKSAVKSDTLTTVADVLKVAESLPIPGIKEALGPLNKLLGILKKPKEPLKEINKKLDEANSKIENQYSIMLAALEVWHLHVNIDNLKTNLLQVIMELDKDSRLYEGKFNLRTEELYSAIKLMIKQALSSTSEGSRLLKDFAKTTKNDNGKLTEYIGKYVSCFYMPYQCIAIAQYTFVMIRDHFEKLQLQNYELTIKDKELVYVCRLYEDILLKKAVSFLGNNVEESYPKWCRPIFKSEAMRLKSRYGDNTMLLALGRDKETTTLEGASLEDAKEESAEPIKFILTEKTEDGRNNDNCWKMHAPNRDAKQLFIIDGRKKEDSKEKDKCKIYSTYTNKIDSKKEKQFAFGIDYDKERLLIKCRKHHKLHLFGAEKVKQGEGHLSCSKDIEKHTKWAIIAIDNSNHLKE